MATAILRNFMPSKTRSSEGCWTCRLRRKKCDERRPICDNCGQLEIQCLYSEEKPEWMDNGPRQAARAEQVKAEVKIQARVRREKKHRNGSQAAPLDHDNDASSVYRSRFAGLASNNQSSVSLSSMYRSHNSHSSHSLHHSQQQNPPPLPPLPPMPPLPPSHPSAPPPAPPKMASPGRNGPTYDSSHNSASAVSPSRYAQAPLADRHRNRGVEPIDHDWVPSGLAMMELDPDDESGMNTDSPCSKSTPTSSHISGGMHTQPSECSMSSPPQMQAEPPAPPQDDQSTYLVVIYMDYVFPYLFPHYRPKILEGGRGWLLALLQHNKALCHTATSFSSYLFAALYNLQNPDHGDTTLQLWHQLQNRQEMALQELQQDMATINAQGIQGNMQESTRVMESIMQLLVFDVSIGNMEHWELHLDAAIALFQQLVPKVDDWPDVISSLTKGFSQPIPGNTHPMSTDLTAFRFFCAVLMYVDVVASTVLARCPRLEAYWPQLLPCAASVTLPYAAPAPIMLENVIGCQNWMLKQIGHISALETWKREEKRKGTFSTESLILQAQMIEQNIRTFAETLDQDNTGQDPSASIFTPQLVMPIHQVGCPLGRKKAQAFDDTGKVHELVPLTTQIWATASIAYLNVVVLGWKPSNNSIKIAVLNTLTLLEQLPSPMFLQAVTWPFVATGCLAPPELQVRYRMLERNMGAIKVSETTKKAVAHMEEMWKMGDRDDFDMSAALRCFGSPFLAI
ncbi:Transcriptional regulatory protein UME6 [Ceratocystis lukuohia]|uniref:Transcriptional regulatory protein UME6 n=1 Tax=Ceratocystis lukuohia TaxID=2019550 RepID=A0ABR4MTR2_9PEZI